VLRRLRAKLAAMLTVHHLNRSQSERIVWLCEELELPYKLVVYARDPVTILAPPELKALHPIGSAPIITDGDVTLAESGTIVDYILGRYARGRLSYGPQAPQYADYLYWLHFSNGTLQPTVSRIFMLERLKVAADDPFALGVHARLGRCLKLVDDRLVAAPYLAGPEFTAADVMSMFSLTTMRLFAPLDIKPYPAILAWLKRLSERPAYKRAMTKGDLGFTPMLT
jgi:glutathione S-transferase